MNSDQIQQIKTWTEERDRLMTELAPLRSEYDSLQVENQKLCASNSQIVDEVIRNTEKLRLLEAGESDRLLLVSEELTMKLIEKAQAESALSSLKAETDAVRQNKEDLEKSLSILLPTLERVTWQVNQLTLTLDKVVSINSNNTNLVNHMVAGLRKFLEGFGIKPSE